MAKGIRSEVFIKRIDGEHVTQYLFDRVMRKFLDLLKSLGLQAEGSWEWEEED